MVSGAYSATISANPLVIGLTIEPAISLTNKFVKVMKVSSFSVAKSVLIFRLSTSSSDSRNSIVVVYVSVISLVPTESSVTDVLEFAAP